MKLIDFEGNLVKISLDKVGEIYSGVCVDCRDFEIIHGVEKNKVLLLDKELKKIYDTWDKC